MRRSRAWRALRFSSSRVELQFIETTGAWGVYAGERIVIGSGDSFRDDLGVKIREMFEAGAAEALDDGRSPSERFELPRVRVDRELAESSAWRASASRAIGDLRRGSRPRRAQAGTR